MTTGKPVTSIFNAGFISITAINFIVYLVYYLLMVIIAVVVHTNLHANLAQAGLASGIYVIGTLIARLIIGHYWSQAIITFWSIEIFSLNVGVLDYSEYRGHVRGTFGEWVRLWNDVDRDECHCDGLHS